MTLPCSAYCSHGGWCALNEGHEGLHSSGFCTWSDAESLNQEEADTALRARSPRLAEVVLGFQDALDPRRGNRRN
jgi:hypothetical protein